MVYRSLITVTTLAVVSHALWGCCSHHDHDPVTLRDAGDVCGHAAESMQTPQHGHDHGTPTDDDGDHHGHLPCHGACCSFTTVAKSDLQRDPSATGQTAALDDASATADRPLAGQRRESLATCSVSGGPLRAQSQVWLL